MPIAELVLSKERILELYLNHIEWGPGRVGRGGGGASTTMGSPRGN